MIFEPILSAEHVTVSSTTHLPFLQLRSRSVFVESDSTLWEFSVHTGGALELDDLTLDDDFALLEDFALELEVAFTELDDFVLLDDFTLLDDFALLELDETFFELDEVAFAELDDTFLDEEDASSGLSGPVLELSPQAENVNPSRADMAKAVANFLICIGTFCVDSVRLNEYI